MNTPRQPACPKCGQALPADAPKGLCPRCLAAMNLATETAFSGADAVAAQPPLTPEELAPHFAQLEILECLGRGGMGVVYQARQKSLHRLVALKLLAPERVQDPEFAVRFAREARALAALNHPHIVTIHDFGQAGGFYFLLMEFVDGVNLRQLLGSRKLTPEEALAIVPPLCDALQYAHDHGIVHRDIKPENLLLDKEGRVKITDFGIARMLGGAGLTSSAGDDKPVGTPGYMAPEQTSTPSLVDSRADIYSLGVVFYEMLTGERPVGELQPPSRKVRIDIRLDEIVLRALEKKPEMRFQTAADLRAEVETFAASGSKPAPSRTAAIPLAATNRPSRRWSVGRVVVVVLSAIIATPSALFLAYLVLGSYRAPRPLAKESAAPAFGPTTKNPFDNTVTFLDGLPSGSIATNQGPVLVVDLGNLLPAMGTPTKVGFRGKPLDPSVLSRREHLACDPLLLPSEEGKPWQIDWAGKPLANLRAVGFLLPDVASAHQAAGQVSHLLNGQAPRLAGAMELVLFNLPQTFQGPYRAWVEFASREE